MLFGDHLTLGKITDHNGPRNQFVSDEMGRLMETILLFIALLLRDTLIDFG